MSQNIFPVDDNTTIVLKMHADLDLQGWDRAEGSAVCRRRDLKIMQAGPGNLVIVCRNDCTLSLPKQVKVTIEHVGGDLNVRNLDAPLAVRHVGGDMAVLDIVSLEAEKIGGDAQIFDVPGLVAVRRVGGDLTAFRLGSSLRAEVGGDAELADLVGDVQLRAGGDIELGLNQFGALPVYLHAGGDIDVHVPQGINAELKVTCGGRDIEVKLDGKRKDYEEGLFSLTIGQGGAELSLLAGGDVCLSDEPFDLDDYKEAVVDIEDDWKGRLEDMEDEDEKPLEGYDEYVQEGFFSPEDHERISRDVNERVSQAMQRVEEAMRKMNDRLAQKGARVVIGKIPTIPPIPPVAPVPPVPPVPAHPAPWNPPDAEAFAADEADAGPSEDERQIILRMLQEKKITADEADELLRALGE